MSQYSDKYDVKLEDVIKYNESMGNTPIEYMQGIRKDIEERDWCDNGEVYEATLWAEYTINDLLAEIEALKAERDAYKQAYEQAMLAGSDDTTVDSFNSYYLAQSSDDAFDTPAFVSCDELEELVSELTDITEPIPYMDDDGEVA